MSVTSLSIVIPCLNEEATLAVCISKARRALSQLSVPGEVLVADNGSTDRSVAICAEEGVRCVPVSVRGYGAALHAGISAASGSHVIFADGDDSYDLSDCAAFVGAFDKGSEVVVGNRYKGGIMKGAMPFLHRYVGTPVISYLGRRSFHVPLGDFNCGMRGVSKDAYLKMGMQSMGMEYATEFVAKAAALGCRITEVPVKLYPDGRGRKPHLKTWSDGWRHLKLILLLSPKWLLLYPGLFFMLAGSVLGTSILFRQVRIFNINLDIHTLYFCSVFLLLSLTFIQFYWMVNYYGMSVGLYPAKGFTMWLSRHLNFEKGLLAGMLLFAAGVVISATAVYRWYEVSFRDLNPQDIFRVIIPAGSCMIAGMQLVVFSFFITLIKNNNRWQ